MDISYRLKSLTKYISKKDKIIDIGCDHALLDIYLIKNNYVDKMIVSDIHENALNQGINNIKKYRLSKKIDARLGNGLEVLKKGDKVNTILISGMGSNTIIKILESDLSNINKMVIQSNNDHELLRKSIINKGYYIEDEEYFKDNDKSYINIVFKKGKKKYSNNELRYGPILIKDKNYLNFELNNCIKIKKMIPRMKLNFKIKLNAEIIYLKYRIKRCD